MRGERRGATYIWSSCLLTSSTSSRSVSSCRTMAPYVSVNSSAFCNRRRTKKTIRPSPMSDLAPALGFREQRTEPEAYDAIHAGEEGVAGLGCWRHRETVRGYPRPSSNPLARRRNRGATGSASWGGVTVWVNGRRARWQRVRPLGSG